MALQVTQTDIVNAAASRLGSSERITSIDGAGSLAGHAAAAWAMTLRRLLADHPWNFCIKRGSLNAAATVPGHGFTRSFELPADCLRVLSPRHDDDDYWLGEVEGGHIHSDAEAPLPVRYIASDLAQDVQRWPPHFAEAMVCAIAEALAEPLTGSQGIRRDAAEAAELALRRAKRIDGLESQNGRRGVVSGRSNWLQSMRQPYNRYWR